MYIIKDKEGNIITLSDDLDYQENGNPLVHNGKLAIVSYIVDSIEETEEIPEGWEYINGEYQPIFDATTFIDEFKTPDELRQEGFDECIAMLMEEGVL